MSSLRGRLSLLFRRDTPGFVIGRALERFAHQRVERPWRKRGIVLL